ncbi:MAG: hypothetical protein GY898_31985 [Proteobacteria bacterium]|nr:hypothetical protein [Pseudomonadota bacterium]
MTSPDLSRTERVVLQLLLQRAGRPVAREELLESIWGISDPSSRTADVAVSRLRRKLEAAPDGCQLRTIRGQGYCVIPGAGAPAIPVESPLELATARVDFSLRTIEGPHGTVSISRVEVELLQRLAGSMGRPVSAQELATAAFGDADGNARKLTAALSRLRTKLEPNPTDPICLLTLRGEGYALRPRTEPPSTLERVPSPRPATLGCSAAIRSSSSCARPSRRIASSRSTAPAESARRRWRFTWAACAGPIRGTPKPWTAWNWRAPAPSPSWGAGSPTRSACWSTPTTKRRCWPLCSCAAPAC